MEFERKTSSKPPKISPWESQWRAVKFDLVKRICQRFWPSVSFKSWQDCLAQLYKEKCYANETVVAWIQAGAEDVSSLSLDLLRMKPSVGFEYREPSKVVDDDGEDKKAQQTTTAADPSFMLLATPTVPSQEMESPNLTKGKKQKISLRGEKMVSLDQEHAKDTPALVRAVKDGDQHGDDDEDDLSEALHNQAFFDDPESTLDEAKIRKLAKLMPVNIALMETMERRRNPSFSKTYRFLMDWSHTRFKRILHHFPKAFLMVKEQRSVCYIFFSLKAGTSSGCVFNDFMKSWTSLPHSINNPRSSWNGKLCCICSWMTWHGQSSCNKRPSWKGMGMDLFFLNRKIRLYLLSSSSN